MAKTSVAKELYRILAEHGDFMASGALEQLHPLNATGSTITRKLRLLESSKFIAVKYVDGHAHYKANRTQAERDAYTPSVAPENALQEPLEPKVKYFITHPITKERIQVV